MSGIKDVLLDVIPGGGYVKQASNVVEGISKHGKKIALLSAGAYGLYKAR
jgi:hypothetical protein